MIKKLFALLLIVSGNSFAHNIDEFKSMDEKSLCEMPIIKKTFVSFEEKKLYDRKIERANRCVIFVTEQNTHKIKKLKSIIDELEAQNYETKKNWNEFIDKARIE